VVGARGREIAVGHAVVLARAGGMRGWGYDLCSWLVGECGNVDLDVGWGREEGQRGRGCVDVPYGKHLYLVHSI
jgi:hypothetical protein